MAITGMLPKVLDNTIVSILDSHSVLNWSIFGETDGNVSIKIRFQANGEGQGTPDVQHISYRRKTEKQVNRDRQRVKKRKLSENSIEITRGESSLIQDNVLDNSPCNLEPDHLPPVHEEIQHNLDLENLENCTDSTLSDTSSIISLNSTACAATANFEVSKDLFFKKDYAESANSVPKPEADPENSIPKPYAEPTNSLLRTDNQSSKPKLIPDIDLDPMDFRNRLHSQFLEYERQSEYLKRRTTRSVDT